MTKELIIVGAILLVLGFLVGVLKQTWLLSGFNEKRVENKGKLAKLVGGYNGIMGIAFVAAGLASFKPIEGLFIVLVAGYVALIAYVNVKMVS